MLYRYRSYNDGGRRKNERLLRNQNYLSHTWLFTILKPLKGITYGGYYIYINLGILSLCTEPWNDTRSMSISLYLCLDSQAFWWIDDVYKIDCENTLTF